MADETLSESPEDRSPAVSRRNLFQIVAAVPAIAAFSTNAADAQTHEAHSHGALHSASIPKTPYRRKVFDDRQFQTVGVLCNLIIPADEHSGSATDAGVPEFLDDWVDYRTSQDGNRDFEAEIFGGLMWLDHESNRLFQADFAAASVEQQKQLLDRIAYPEKAAPEDRAAAAFFTHFRSLTVSGFFSSKIGIADLPYLGNTAVVEWKGCDPKVWAIVEERMKHGYSGILASKPWSS